MKRLSLPFILFSFFMCAEGDLACPPKRRDCGGSWGDGIPSSLPEEFTADFVDDSNDNNSSREHAEWRHQPATAGVAESGKTLRISIVEERVTLDIADCSFFNGFYAAQDMSDAMKINVIKYYQNAINNFRSLMGTGREINQIKLISYLDGALEALLLHHTGPAPTNPRVKSITQTLFKLGITTKLKDLRERPNTSDASSLPFYRGIAVQADLTAAHNGYFEDRTPTSNVPTFWDSLHRDAGPTTEEIVDTIKRTGFPSLLGKTKKKQPGAAALAPEELETKIVEAKAAEAALLAEIDKEDEKDRKEKEKIAQQAAKRLSKTASKMEKPALATATHTPPPKTGAGSFVAAAAVVAPAVDEFDKTEWTPARVPQPQKAPSKKGPVREKQSHAAQTRHDKRPVALPAPRTDAKPPMASPAREATAAASPRQIATTSQPKPQSKATLHAAPSTSPFSIPASAATCMPPQELSLREEDTHPVMAASAAALPVTAPSDGGGGTTTASSEPDPAPPAGASGSDDSDDLPSAPASVTSAGVSSCSSHGSGSSAVDKTPLTPLIIPYPGNTYFHGVHDGILKMLQAPTSDKSIFIDNFSYADLEIQRWQTALTTRGHTQKNILDSLSYWTGFKDGIIQGNILQSDCFFRGKMALGNKRQITSLKNQINSLELPEKIKCVLLHTMANGIAKAALELTARDE